MDQIKRLGHEIDEYGLKPKEENVEAILNLKPTENMKEKNHFSGNAVYGKILTKNLRNKQTDCEIYCKTNEPWIWGEEQQNISEKKRNKC